MSEERGQADVKIFLGVAVSLALAVFVGIFVLLRNPPADLPAAGSPPDVDRTLRPFVLTERSGADVSRESLSNKFLVVNFIHTGCSISCEQVNKRMTEVQRLVADQADVQLLSLSVDPRSDTPPALVKFAERFSADSKKWLFLTGDKTEVYDLIEYSFLRRHTGAGINPELGGFLDTDRIALVDRSGKVRRYFNGMQSSAPQSIGDAIQHLRSDSAQR